MINKVFPFFLVLISFASCNDAPLVFESKNLDQNTVVSCKDKPCPQVNVDYITYTGEEVVTATINKRIEAFCIASLYLGDPELKPTASGITEAVGQFIDDYWRDTSEFPDINEYEAEVSVEETFRSKEFVTVALSQYSYVGGAHGYGGVKYVNFDIKTGEILTNEQLIKDTEALKVLAEKQLRKDYKLSEEESLNATIFWFENDAFHFSDNIGFDDGHMIIHYNQYEIASYADGAIDIELPLQEVAPFIKYSLEH